MAAAGRASASGVPPAAGVELGGPAGTGGVGVAPCMMDGGAAAGCEDAACAVDAGDVEGVGGAGDAVVAGAGEGAFAGGVEV